MPKATILFAENDPDFLQIRSEFLQQEGYQVIPAVNPTEARRKLEAGDIDLAILDIRLVNDDDEQDTSGLTLAKEVAQTIPKIILTGFPSYEYVREALKPQLDGLPAAVDFVAKQEGPEALLSAIRRGLSVRKGEIPLVQELERRLPPVSFPIATQLRKGSVLKEEIPSVQELEKRLTPVSFPIATQLCKDYEEVRKDAILLSRARFACVVIGAVVILVGSTGVLIGQVAIGALSAVSGIITEALAALLNRSVRDAYRRMDRYHQELLMLYNKQIGKHHS